MTIDERRKAIGEGLAEEIRLYWRSHFSGFLTEAQRQALSNHILAFLSDNGVVLQVTGENRWQADPAKITPLVAPEALASLDTGMAQSVSGHTVNLGSFAQYVEPEKPSGLASESPSGVELPDTASGGRVVDYSAGQ